jgi:hypothetical protein
VLDEASQASYWSEEPEDVGFELLCMDSQFGWDGIQWWMPVGVNKEFFGGHFVSSKVDFEIKVSLESTKVFL